MKVDRHVQADKGIETLLDHALLEAEPEFAFGVLLGRLAGFSKDDSSSHQFYVSHALPLDTATKSRGGPDVTSASFLAHLNDSLVGGVSVVGFYAIYNDTVTRGVLDRIAKAALATKPAVFFEKTDDSHQFKGRLYFAESGNSEPADINFSGLIPASFKVVQSTFSISNQPALLHLERPRSEEENSRTHVLGKALEHCLNAVLEGSVGTIAKTGVPLEAYPSVSALPHAPVVNMYLTNTSSFLNNSGSSTATDSLQLSEATIDLTMSCNAVLVANEPAAACMDALREDILRSVRCMCLNAIEADNGFSFPNRVLVHSSASNVIVSATSSKKKRGRPTLPLISNYFFKSGSMLPAYGSLFSVIENAGFSELFGASDSEQVTDRDPSSSQKQTLVVTRFLSSDEAQIAEGDSIPTTNEQSALVHSSSAVGTDQNSLIEDEDLSQLDIEVTEEGSAETTLGRTEEETKHDERQSSKSTSLRQRATGPSEDTTTKTTTNSKDHNVVANAIKEELGYDKHAHAATKVASSQQRSIMVVVVGIAITAVVFALAMAIFR